MKRREAEALIGQTVQAWTAMNGEYLGVLEAVDGSPWRGTVRITGVIAVAQHLYLGHPCRRGFRPGETIEVGGNSIRTISPGETSFPTDYLEALQRTRAYCVEHAPQSQGGPNAWLAAQLISALDVVIEAEMRRLDGDDWSLHPKRAESPRCYEG